MQCILVSDCAIFTAFSQYNTYSDFVQLHADCFRPVHQNMIIHCFGRSRSGCSQATERALLTVGVTMPSCLPKVLRVLILDTAIRQDKERSPISRITNSQPSGRIKSSEPPTRKRNSQPSGKIKNSQPSGRIRGSQRSGKIKKSLPPTRIIQNTEPLLSINNI